jgi:hypothetical protein
VDVCRRRDKYRNPILDGDGAIASLADQGVLLRYQLATAAVAHQDFQMVHLYFSWLSE